MRNKRFSLFALILTAALTLVLTLGGIALTAWLRLGPGGLAVLESVELINSRFVGEYEKDQVTDSALEAMVDSLGDRWSLYLDPQAYAAMQLSRANAYVGVGLTYRPLDDGSAIEILELVSGGPAERAGLAVGERITAIDGQSFTPENLQELVATISTSEGRELVFTVVNAQGESREARLRADKVETSPVEYRMLDNGVGYVRLNNFYSGSAQRTQEAVEELERQGAKALLFDVRYNPGGYVQELTQLLDFLLPEGPIFAEHVKNGPVKTIRSDAQCVDLPMAVLVNQDSYSAAELFAGQLRESVAAPLIGTQTCGKGYYQQAFPLPNGGGLNLSTGMYTTGGGVSLIGTGLVPDVVEEDPVAQMERAVELLEEKMG